MPNEAIHNQLCGAASVEAHVDVRLGSLLRDVGDGHGLLSSLVQVLGCDQLHTGIVEELQRRLQIGALQANDQGLGKVELLDGVDETAGDDVAPHDTTEDVDQHGLHRVVLLHDFERLQHLILGGAAANVQEVGGLASLELDHVHGGHGQAGSVDEAAHVTVQRNVVEVEFLRNHFTGIVL